MALVFGISSSSFNIEKDFEGTYRSASVDREKWRERMESPRIVQKRVASTVSDQSAPVVYNRTVDFPDERWQTYVLDTTVSSESAQVY